MNMTVYEVGGAVRDALLGRPVHDRDWVVVGATPEHMMALGFKPVGRDFPVFVHPQTGEEYALARTERKTQPGYRGFVVHCAPDVRLEDDLRRRDLTINAMARAADGALIDPWGGQRDLHARQLRHVSPAFSEDPVRILRVARFAARLPDFTIAPETLALMHAMVQQGEVDALVPERVWQELARGLGESDPSHMIDVLQACGALAALIPELIGHWHPPTARALDTAATQGASVAVRWAILLHACSAPAALQRCQQLKVPNECRDLLRLTLQERARIRDAAELDAPALWALLERCDALRHPGRLTELLTVCELLPHPSHNAQPAMERLQRACTAARSVPAGRIAAQIDPSLPPHGRAAHIQSAVRNARIAAIEAALPASGRTSPGQTPQ
jgi:tRNA nucleotidyltransferase (CCA-adding enzyme)